MGKQATVKEQVISGLLSAGGWLLGSLVCACDLGHHKCFRRRRQTFRRGTILPESGIRDPGVAAAIFVATANRWKRVFPGIMVAATFGALLELEHGHALNYPTVLIPRWIALVQLVVIAGVTALSFTFKKRPLNLIDRIALLVFAASIYVGGDEAHRQQLPLALIVGGLCVLAAWAYDRLQRHRRNSPPHPNHVIA